MKLILGFALAALVSAANFTSSAAENNQLSDKEKAEGWKRLFDGKNTDQWHSVKKTTFPTNEWVVEAGWLHCLGTNGGDIVSAEEFADFEFEWDWRIAPGGNSGVKYFVADARRDVGHEYQMLDDVKNPDGVAKGGTHTTASFYDVLKPANAKTKPIGEVNHSRILVKGNHVEHWLNGVNVLTYECDSDAVKAAVAASKFKNVAGFADPVKGRLLLQDHRSEVWFQNLIIRVPAK